MGKLKRLPYDKLMFEIRSMKDETSSPWIVLHSFEFAADTRGDLCGQCDLNGAKNRQEVAIALGEMMIENSPRILKWLRKAGMTDD